MAEPIYVRYTRQLPNFGSFSWFLCEDPVFYSPPCNIRNAQHCDLFIHYPRRKTAGSDFEEAEVAVAMWIYKAPSHGAGEWCSIWLGDKYPFPNPGKPDRLLHFDRTSKKPSWVVERTYVMYDAANRRRNRDLDRIAVSVFLSSLLPYLSKDLKQPLQRAPSGLAPFNSQKQRHIIEPSS